MSPLVAQRLASARENFDGQIIVVKDLGNQALVLIVPAAREDVSGEDDDWGQVVKPAFMLIDPSRVRDGKPQ